jgi:plasmid stabilization system protein ParE
MIETSDGAPVHAVRVSESFATQSEAATDWLLENTDVDTAADWFIGLQAAKASLATLPHRCPVADENRMYQKKHSGPSLLALRYAHGRSTWRLLFTVHEAKEGDRPYVQLHQLRHGAQKPLTKWPDENQTN